MTLQDEYFDRKVFEIAKIGAINLSSIFQVKNNAIQLSLFRKLTLDYWAVFDKVNLPIFSRGYGKVSFSSITIVVLSRI
ncbi:MAG: hypothetical protein DSY85_16575 [Marinomonas sp.]|nr:MAG: hypothetical protein DSY85_16575 [Marinomonas sp.]